ncbi:MerR family transcriptional regulator [Pseudomonas proteolytica]|jgi:MerR family copper efflux transcriptional regulator|uniref:MerR family transcriptional regulator n=1 Tax=Pseudomonas TaxID=286 RepID=UPI000CF34C61|nr:MULTISPECIES: MerR family transcriptional regulator [Pseudomonas]MDF3160639.1 MerR family transcriptional regulator [Pseudomonas proteolytica]
MYIGELAKLTGCTPKAIRLYEQLGLLTPQRRGSYRLYTAHHLTLVQMIRRAQAAGFKLGELSELLAAKQHQAPFPLALANQGIEAKRLELQAQILVLQDRQQHLTQLQHQINQQFAPASAGQ